MKLTKPFIFSAAGVTSAGKSTAMCFLAEVLHEKGYQNLQYADKISTMLEITSVSDKNDPPIVILPHIRYSDYMILHDLSNCLLFYIGRTDYTDGKMNQIEKYYHPADDEKWIADARFDIHVNNDSTMRVFKWLIKEAFENQILNNKKWKDAHELR